MLNVIVLKVIMLNVMVQIFAVKGSRYGSELK
jgi:hypothetical protein